MKISSLKSDGRLAIEGGWVGPDILGVPGLWLRVRPANCVEAQRIWRRCMNAVPKARRFSGNDPEDERHATTESLIEAILLEWRGITEDDDKTPIKYSREKAREWLESPDYEGFRELVIFASTVVREMGAVQLQDDVGN